jgi:indolepyruvate ferredoxin oxidoreductase
MSPPVSLDDKYARDHGRVFISGTQALVRLPLMQLERDRAAGFDTACYITGYRGSPLAGLDRQLAAGKKFFDGKPIVFQPGLNEDLAATAVWGTQQAGLNGPAKHAGVFAMWYAKGPGVDRSGDALRHGNLAGSAPLGGVLLLAGDDHTCESSTTCHQSEFAFADAMIPVLNPADVQEIIDFGLYGWELSRYSGCWVALKCVKDNVEATASVAIDPGRIAIRVPSDHVLPAKGLGIRWPDTPQDQETRLHEHKLAAAQAFCRANGLDRVVIDSPAARLGIATTGKSYTDVRQALELLGLDDEAAVAAGIRLFKIGMSWPLEPHAARTFAEGLDLVMVVEEKRSLIETQLKELLYSRTGAPRIVGKHDEHGASLFPSAGALDPAQIAAAIARRLGRPAASPVTSVSGRDLLQRGVHFCAGCPHNTSTRLPADSRGYCGIGCSGMVQFMDRGTAGLTQMGGEGLSWVGEAPFAKDAHVFQTLGDGTYYHSGLLAIRAAVASRTNITFKILFNDAVAMTGGQAHDGPLTVQAITRQVHAEGVAGVVVVSDEPHKYGVRKQGFAPGVTIHGRDELDDVQRRLRETPGTTVLVFDQACATEKRRRRKRGLAPDPARRLFIYDPVCEGCGDCGVQSNCTAIVPLETPLGRKRAIDQFACNTDFSCLTGFCPSFVTVTGGQPRAGKGIALDAPFAALPEPQLPALDRPYSIVVAGIGGTGVVTIGAILGMAAHIEGRGSGVLDMTGLAQKGGSVWTHIKIGATQEAIHAIRAAPGRADLVLGCDLVVAASGHTRALLRRGGSSVVLNTAAVLPGEFTRKPDLVFPGAQMRAAIEASAGAQHVHAVDAGAIARALFGDSITVNMFMLGYAWQKGLVPVGARALELAIRLNGASVAQNSAAFLWGRRAAHDPAAVMRLLAVAPPPPRTLDDTIQFHVDFLTDYQDAAYAERYIALVVAARAREHALIPGSTRLTEAVARNYFKLLAYKDEYEVARLYARPDFARELAGQFEGNYRIAFNLAPPLLAPRDRATGLPRKISVGPWLLTVFRLLARARRLRGTPFDPFGWTSERRAERALIGWYERLVAEIISDLPSGNHDVAIELASLPTSIRGFGHVKAKAIAQAKARELELRAAWRKPPQPASVAA